ncbi:LYR motif-containing protein 1 [Patella vulgata]|uniref:LYR motif-containing protein 1 n=1 Tax=Patella vulgata TaxID=6465 RepID=UPI00217FA785|nr:LYR motif-containing protein 1 [Patella vulgata]XP_055954714.1 LYR motif-containing protein 1 [Patella vulgata]
MAQTRKEVLSLYKRILNTARKWNSASGDSTECKTEKQYIKEETRMLFKRNKEVTDQEEIKEFIREGETRLELALHYRTPYPRPVNIPQSTLPPGNFKMKKAQKRVIEQSKPIYIKSYKDNT